MSSVSIIGKGLLTEKTFHEQKKSCVHMAVCAPMPVNALYKQRKSTFTHHKAQNMHTEEHRLRICFKMKTQTM